MFHNFTSADLFNICMIQLNIYPKISQLKQEIRNKKSYTVIITVAVSLKNSKSSEKVEASFDPEITPVQQVTQIDYSL